VVVLERPGTTLILGEDLDNTSNGAGANGTGKTVLLNAIVYAIYDKPLSDISKDNLVNNINKKNMEVTIEFEQDGKQYKVHRARKLKAGAGGNQVHLYEDGKDITLDSVSNTNDLIERIVGLPYELFVRIVTFSANHVPFLDLPVRSHYAANQTDIIEELFDLKTLSEKAILLKDQIKSAELSLETNETHAAHLESEHVRLDKQLVSARNRVDSWVIQNKNEILDIGTKLKKLENINVEEQEQFHATLISINDRLRGEVSELKNIERNITKITKSLKKVKSELSHLQDAECPYCLQAYEDTKSKIVEAEADIIQFTKDIHMEGDKLIQADERVLSLHVEREDVSKNITVDDIGELTEIKNKAGRYTDRVVELKKANNPFNEPLTELEDIELEVVDMSTINDIRDNITHQKFLLKLLTKKDSFVRKALLHKNIPYLNQRLQHYLSELGLAHTVEFTHEMTASISQFGRLMDFGNLSNGQRARVNLALSFAFRDVLTSMHGQLNICMLDEVLDVGLDTVGVQAAAKMLKRKARDEKISMYIISHKGDEVGSIFDHKLTVQMSKGFSYISFDE